MGPGDLVRISKENRTHGSKTALIVGKELDSWYDTTIGRYRHEVSFSIILDGRVRNGVAERWLEVIDETR